MRIKFHKLIDTDLCTAQIYVSIININNVEEFHVVYVEDVEVEYIDESEIKYHLNCALCAGEFSEEWYYSLEDAIEDNNFDGIEVITGLEGQELNI